jgi:glycosyltransferase involved in cell wall biosynthesis
LNSVSDILDQVKHLDRGSRYTDADLMNLAHSLSWNLSITRRKRLYVDITELATYNKSTGIQRVVKSIISEFLASANERFDILPIVRSDGRYKYATEYVTKEIDQEFFSVGKHGTVAFGAKDVFLGLDLDLQVDEGAREVLRHAREGGTKVFFVIYDVLACSHPDWFNDELFGFFRWHYEKISELADALFCISDTVADEVKQMLDQLSLRSMPLPIYSFRLGAEFVSNVKPLSEKSVPLPVPLPEKFLLMVGTIEPRKGYQCILLAMNEIWAKGSDYSLVIIGRAGWLCDELTEFIELSNYYQKQLFWISEASDALLISAYEKASGLVAASYNEGFGLPIVEAARFGLPLFLRDIPVFREVAGGSATYFSSDTFSISKQLEQWMSQIDAGSEQASSAVQVVTWQESAEELKVLVGGNVQTRNVWLVGEHYLWSLNSIFAVNVEYPFSVVEPFSILVGERTEEGLVTSEVGALHIVTSKRKLSKGRYQLTVSLGSSCIVHSILMEVRTEGRLALAQSSFEPSNNTVSALLDFENDTHGVEVDVQQGASIGLCIKSISISRLEDDEVPDDEVLISLE